MNRMAVHGVLALAVRSGFASGGGEEAGRLVRGGEAGMLEGPCSLAIVGSGNSDAGSGGMAGGRLRGVGRSVGQAGGGVRR